MGFDGDRVWFVNDQRLAAGEEAGGVRVISVSAPWSARLAYSGWEGDVTIFRRTSDQLLNGDSSARSMPRGMTEVKGTGAPPSTAKPPKAEDEPDE